MQPQAKILATPIQSYEYPVSQNKIKDADCNVIVRSLYELNVEILRWLIFVRSINFAVNNQSSSCNVVNLHYYRA